MQIVLLRDGTAHGDAKGIVESVHADPVHTKFLLIVRGQLREHLLAVLRVLLEHHIPARPRILGINVECAALHPRLDVRCAATDARRNARLQSRILLNDHLQHLTHDKLLRHHRNYCMQQRHGIPLPYRIGITNQKMLIFSAKARTK